MATLVEIPQESITIRDLYNTLDKVLSRRAASAGTKPKAFAGTRRIYPPNPKKPLTEKDAAAIESSLKGEGKGIIKFTETDSKKEEKTIFRSTNGSVDIDEGRFQATVLDELDNVSARNEYMTLLQQHPEYKGGEMTREELLKEDETVQKHSDTLVSEMAQQKGIEPEKYDRILAQGSPYIEFQQDIKVQVSPDDPKISEGLNYPSKRSSEYRKQTEQKQQPQEKPTEVQTYPSLDHPDGEYSVQKDVAVSPPEPSIKDADVGIAPGQSTDEGKTQLVQPDGATLEPDETAVETPVQSEPEVIPEPQAESAEVSPPSELEISGAEEHMDAAIAAVAEEDDGRFAQGNTPGSLDDAILASQAQLEQIQKDLEAAKDKINNMVKTVSAFTEKAKNLKSENVREWSQSAAKEGVSSLQSRIKAASAAALQRGKELGQKALVGYQKALDVAEAKILGVQDIDRGLVNTLEKYGKETADGIKFKQGEYSIKAKDGTLEVSHATRGAVWKIESGKSGSFESKDSRDLGVLSKLAQVAKESAVETAKETQTQKSTAVRM
jgi:hypothetical protein